MTFLITPKNPIDFEVLEFKTQQWVLRGGKEQLDGIGLKIQASIGFLVAEIPLSLIENNGIMDRDSGYWAGIPVTIVQI